MFISVLVLQDPSFYHVYLSPSSQGSIFLSCLSQSYFSRIPLLMFSPSFGSYSFNIYLSLFISISPTYCIVLAVQICMSFESNHNLNLKTICWPILVYHLYPGSSSSLSRLFICIQVLVYLYPGSSSSLSRF